MSHSIIILDILRGTNAQSYLELGVAEGAIFLPMVEAIPRAIEAGLTIVRRLRDRRVLDDLGTTHGDRI